MTPRRQLDNEGRPLQPHLAAELDRQRDRPSVDDLMDRIDRRSSGHVSFEQAVQDLAEDRDGEAAERSVPTENPVKTPLLPLPGLRSLDDEFCSGSRLD